MNAIFDLTVLTRPRHLLIPSGGTNPLRSLRPWRFDFTVSRLEGGSRSFD